MTKFDHIIKKSMKYNFFNKNNMNNKWSNAFLETKHKTNYIKSTNNN